MMELTNRTHWALLQRENEIEAALEVEPSEETPEARRLLAEFDAIENELERRADRRIAEHLTEAAYYASRVTQA